MIRRLFILAALLQAACTPALDWREVRLSDAGAVAAFPCKPSHASRRIQLVGREVEMALHSCTAAGTTWAVSHVDVADPSRVGPALDALSAALLNNVGAAEPIPTNEPFTVTGMTPNPRAVRLRAVGTRPDGSAVTVEAAVFAKGTRVFQATMLTGKPDTRSSQTFFESLRLP
jgi:hypothetical protein